MRTITAVTAILDLPFDGMSIILTKTRAGSILLRPLRSCRPTESHDTPPGDAPTAGGQGDALERVGVSGAGGAGSVPGGIAISSRSDHGAGVVVAELVEADRPKTRLPPQPLRAAKGVARIKRLLPRSSRRRSLAHHSTVGAGVPEARRKKSPSTGSLSPGIRLRLTLQPLRGRALPRGPTASRGGTRAAGCLSSDAGFASSDLIVS